jgi:hypothetical protein
MAARVVNPFFQAEHGEEPGPDPQINEWRECGTWNSPQEVRENCPHKPGDIVWVNFGGDGHPDGVVQPRIKLCRVYEHSCYYLQSSLEWIATFRVQWVTKKGKWSKTVVKVYAGDIYRAYFDYDETPRDNKWQ